MRTRRSFQPSLDWMPSRIAPSGGMLNAAMAPAIAPGVHMGGGVQPADIADPTNTLTGEGSTLIIIQPITPPTTLLC